MFRRVWPADVNQDNTRLTKGQSLYEHLHLFHLTSRPLHLHTNCNVKLKYIIQYISFAVSTKNIIVLYDDHQKAYKSQHIYDLPQPCLLPTAVCRSVAVSPKSFPLQTSHRFNYTREDMFLTFFLANLESWRSQNIFCGCCGYHDHQSSVKVILKESPPCVAAQPRCFSCWPTAVPQWVRGVIHLTHPDTRD